MNEALKRFSEADWDEMLPRLVQYALFKVRRLEWRTGDFLPRGMMPEDLALEAIRKTCDGLSGARRGKGVRIWNPEKDPELLHFLRSVIDSDVHALVQSSEHKLTQYMARETAEEAAQSSAELVDREFMHSGPALSSDLMSMNSTEHSLGAEQAMMAREAYIIRESQAKFDVERLLRECSREKDEEGLLVLMAYEKALSENQKIKPSTISEITGLNAAETRNTIRRLVRRMERIRRSKKGSKKKEEVIYEVESTK